MVLERGPGFPGGAAFSVTAMAAGRTILEYTCDVHDEHPGVETERSVLSGNSESERFTLSGADAAKTPPLSPPDRRDAVTLFFDEVSRALTSVTNSLKQSGLTAVPEPTSLSILAHGIAGLVTLQNAPPLAEAGEAGPMVHRGSVEPAGGDAGLKPFWGESPGDRLGRRAGSQPTEIAERISSRSR